MSRYLLPKRRSTQPGIQGRIVTIIVYHQAHVESQG